MPRRTRNKPTHYDKDIHIRIHEHYVELIKKKAEENNITMALMLRNIIEEYFKDEQPPLQ